jgi:hypothetical protein
MSKYDRVQFYGTALTLLAARMKCHGCGRMRAVCFSCYIFFFLENCIETCLLNANFISNKILSGYQPCQVVKR